MGALEAFLIQLWTYLWIRALSTLILFVSISQLVFGSMKFYLRKIEKLKEGKTHEKIIAKAEKPAAILIILAGLKFSLQYLDYDLHIIQKILTSVLIIIGIYFVIAAIDIIIDRWIYMFKKKTGSSYEDEGLNLIESIINIFLAAIALILILKVWGVSIGPFLTSLGIIGIAVGFAMQRTLSNIIGGVALVLDKCFRINDLIKLESDEVGRVAEVGLRSTKIVTLDNELLIIPNSQLSGARIINYAKPNNILRIKVPIAVAYGSEPDEVMKVILSRMKQLKAVLPEPKPLARFVGFGDFSLDFELLFYIEDYHDRFTAKTQVLKAVYKNLNKAGIKIPFPTRTLYMENKGKTKKTVKKTAKRKKK